MAKITSSSRLLLTFYAPQIVKDDMYRRRLISIPSMYFMFEQGDAPLLILDIAA